MNNVAIRPLKEILELRYGKPISQVDRDSNGKNYIYGANGILGKTNKYLIDGDAIIVGRKGSAGQVNRVSGKFWPADVTYYILENEFFNIDYLYFLLNHLNLPKLAKGVKPGLNRNDVYSINVPIPSVGIQKNIAEILYKAQLLYQKREKTLVLLDDYLKSSFLKMFSKEKTDWLTLKEVSNFIDYRGKTPTKTSSGINLITAKNVKEGYLDFNPEEFIATEDYLSWMRRGFPKAGDILFTTEAPLGNTAILPKFDKLAFAQRIIIIQPKAMLKSEFLLFALNSTAVKDDIFSRSTGSTVKGIRSKELVKVKIPVPELKKQEEFVKIYNSKMKLKQKMNVQLNLMKTQFQALMQKSFSLQQ